MQGRTRSRMAYGNAVKMGIKIFFIQVRIANIVKLYGNPNFHKQNMIRFELRLQHRPFSSSSCKQPAVESCCLRMR